MIYTVVFGSTHVLQVNPGDHVFVNGAAKGTEGFYTANLGMMHHIYKAVFGTCSQKL